MADLLTPPSHQRGHRRSSLAGVAMTLKAGSLFQGKGKAKQTGSQKAIDANSSKTDMSTHIATESPDKTDSPAGQGVDNMEKEMTNMKLRLLQDIFEEADEDGGGGLDMDEFRNAMRKAMGDHLTDHELDQTFMKVDTNCDGTVDWDEYLSYMLLEYREKDRMNFVLASRPFPNELQLVTDLQSYQRNHDVIERVAFMPSLTKTSTGQYVSLDDGQGKYVTASKDGVINFWNLDFKHLRVNIIEPKKGVPKNIGVWVTDMITLPNLNLIAVATTSCTITFYDLTVGKFHPIKQVTELEICATCLDYWHDPKKPEALLLWGDVRGNICALEFSGFEFLQPKLSKKQKPYMSFPKLLQGEEASITAYRLPHIHDDFVIKVTYIHVLDAFLSCSKSGTTSLFKGDLSKKKATYFNVRRGVLSFDYCTKNNVIITGGKDAIVRVWNPYVQRKPVMLLQGHKTAVIYVAINDVLEHIVSISEDKEINVFDMNTQTCIQTIYRKWVPLGPKPISAVYFHPGRQALVLSNNKIGVFEHLQKTRVCARDQLDIKSHNKPVNVVLYNSLFNQVVSGGADSKVNVWDIVTGQRIMQFKAHTMAKKMGRPVDMEVTAMTFDPTKRRLLTAGQDGALKIWNFNNGALLRQLQTFDQKEITGVVWYNQRIFAAGWNRQILMYVDTAEDEGVTVWEKHHREDIHTLAYLSPGTVASASYDGDILIWSVDTHHVINKMNATQSTKPTIQKMLSYAKLYDCRKDSKRDSISPSPTIPSTVTNPGEDRKGERLRKIRQRIATYGVMAMGRLKENINDEESKIRCTPSMENEDEDFTFDRSPEACIERLLFLDTRPTHRNAANLVSVDANGWIRFWSIHHNGGLLGQFNAAHIPGGSVTGIATDSDNYFLFTGDSDGFMKTWDISTYCVPPSVIYPVYGKESKAELMEDFPLVGGYEKLMEKANTKQDLFCAPPPSTKPGKTWNPPPLVNSFRAHLQCIRFIEYIPEHQCLLTCGVDCSIRMWTIHGKFIGIFNHNTPWNRPPEPKKEEVKEGMAPNVQQVLGKAMKQELTKVRLPPDVRRVASATTLRVFYGKHRSTWKWAKNIVLLLIPLFKHTNNQSKMAKLASGQDAAGSEMPDRPPMEGELDLKQKKHEKGVRVVSAKGRRTKSGKERKKRSILGGHINIDRKHHPLPKLKKIRQFHHQCDVYSSLPYHELNKVPTALDMEPPDCIKDIRARQKLMNPFKASGKRVRTLVRLGGAIKSTPRASRMGNVSNQEVSLFPKL